MHSSSFLASRLLCAYNTYIYISSTSLASEKKKENARRRNGKERNIERTPAVNADIYIACATTVKAPWAHTYNTRYILSLSLSLSLSLFLSFSLFLAQRACKMRRILPRSHIDTHIHVCIYIYIHTQESERELFVYMHSRRARAAVKVDLEGGKSMRGAAAVTAGKPEGRARARERSRGF